MLSASCFVSTPYRSTPVAKRDKIQPERFVKTRPLPRVFISLDPRKYYGTSVALPPLPEAFLGDLLSYNDARLTPPLQ